MSKRGYSPDLSCRPSRHVLVKSEAHQEEPLSPILGLGVNPFPRRSINPLRPNNDLSQTSHCNIKGV